VPDVFVCPIDAYPKRFTCSKTDTYMTWVSGILACTNLAAALFFLWASARQWRILCRAAHIQPTQL
jgi:hypothetical protein